jgi:protein phosphatase
MLALEVGVASDQGLGRERNEDAARFAQSAASRVSFIVADGMGGYGGGQEAALIASRTVLEWLKTSGQTGGPFESNVESALVAANEAILEAQSRGSPDMGCTTLAGSVEGNTIVLGHLGDVRALLYRDGRLNTVTHDHNPWNDQRRLNAGDSPAPPADTGAPTEDLEPTRALGRAMMRPEITRRTLTAGDVLIVCTDGVWRAVSLEKMASIIRNGPSDAWSLASKLVDVARNDQSAEDNITALVLRCEPGAATRPAALATRRWTSVAVALSAVVVAFVLGSVFRNALIPLRPPNDGDAARGEGPAASAPRADRAGAYPSHAPPPSTARADQSDQTPAMTPSQPDTVAQSATTVDTAGSTPTELPRDLPTSPEAAPSATSNTTAAVASNQKSTGSLAGKVGGQPPKLSLRLIPTDATVSFDGIPGTYRHRGSVSIPIGWITVRAEAPDSASASGKTRVDATSRVLEVKLCASRALVGYSRSCTPSIHFVDR